MKKPTNKRRNTGMALPIVFVFIVVLMLFVFSMVTFRKETRFKNLVTFHYLKAHLMAQSGIQHAMMKIRLCPDEAFEAAARQFGICPLNDNNSSSTPGSGNTDLMETFISDLRCDDLGIAGSDGSGYEVKKIVTKTAFRKNNRLVTMVEIESHGWAIEGKSNLNKRSEIVKKTVSIVKSN